MAENSVKNTKKRYIEKPHRNSYSATVIRPVKETQEMQLSGNKI